MCGCLSHLFSFAFFGGSERLPPGEYNITTSSGESEIALTQHLKQVGAKMYGAFWCPHCQEQKQLFG